MKIVKINISELKSPEKNVRIHTEKQIEEFVRSVKMFGQIRPVVVDENYVILAGNGLVESLTVMGATEVDALVMENLTENQKKKLMIADNKIFSLGIENLETLNSFLEDLQDDLDIPGFDEEILKTMVADGEEVTEKISEYGTLDEDEIKAIKERQEKRKVAEQKSGDLSTPETTLQQNSVVMATNEHSEEEAEPADVRKFVICPKCGEKIWL
ncbi:ParB/Srx family N-terminal domain-containing protein [Anaerovorax sp. IOR16]|uniref:ParB/Srx family N-terminal domain-containing protein n=1 Tax=Anaerovorax sp. IOR16 TaxID=2773458 RepID=UPI0019D0D934|nr:ParB/Srx family N-terminal domain-containing protein [Anaerovorax sp. IOR16]